MLKPNHSLYWKILLQSNHPSRLTSVGHVNIDSLIKYLTNSNSKTYTWSINRKIHGKILKFHYPILKVPGISIYVSLMPPTNASPSEPFQLDFIQWAKEIANLSLRYSNLKGYSIDNFQENVNLNYFNQTYIDNI